MNYLIAYRSAATVSRGFSLDLHLDALPALPRWKWSILGYFTLPLDAECVADARRRCRSWSVRGVRCPGGLNQGYLMLGQPVERRVVCAYRTQCCFFKLGANSGKIENRQAGFISEAALELYGRHL